MPITSDPVRDAAVHFGRLDALQRAVDVEAGWIRDQLSAGHGRALSTKVRGCWHPYSREDVSLAAEFVAWIHETRDEPDADIASLLFSGQGNFHPLIREFARDYAQWEYDTGVLTIDDAEAA